MGEDGWADVLRRHRVALGVGVAVGTALAIVGLVGDVTTWWVYVTVSVVGAAVVLLAARRGLSRVAVWGLVAFGLGNLAGGMVSFGGEVLYAHWLLEPIVRFDNLQHAVGFGAVGRAGWELLSPRLDAAAADRVVVVVTIVAVGVAAGAVNEIVEWVMTLTIPGVDIGGYDNTARDLVANLVGSLAWAAATARR